MEIKHEIIKEIPNNFSRLAGKRKILFNKMRELYPKGKKESQIKLCLKISEDRIDYYINNIFIRE